MVDLPLDPIQRKSLIIIIIAEKISTINQINFTGLQCLKSGRCLRDILYDNFIIVRSLAPIVLVSDKTCTIAGNHFFTNVRTCTDNIFECLEVLSFKHIRRHHSSNILEAEVIDIREARGSIMNGHRVFVNNLYAFNVVNAL